MFWLQLMKSFNIALCSNNKKKKVIWLHLAQVTYLPQRVAMIWCSSWIKRAVALCMLQAVDGVCSENETDAGIIHLLHPVPRGVPWAPKLALALGLRGSECSPGGSLFLPFAYLPSGSVNIWGRLTEVDQPCCMWLAGYQSFVSDLAHSERDLQMILDPSTEVGNKGTCAPWSLVTNRKNVQHG